MMKEDHMRNGQLKPAYNVQIAVNSEYITGIEAFSNRTDMGTFIPFMRKLEMAHQQRYEEVARMPVTKAWIITCTWKPTVK